MNLPSRTVDFIKTARSFLGQTRTRNACVNLNTRRDTSLPIADAAIAVNSVGSLLGDTSDACMSGGTVVMVFSILFGGFALGQAGPAFESLAKARIAAAKIYKIIDRVPENGIDTRKPTGKELSLPVKGDIEFETCTLPTALNRKVFDGINLKIDGGTAKRVSWSKWMWKIDHREIVGAIL